MQLNFRFGFPFPNSTHPDSEVMDYGHCYDLNMIRMCELYRAIKNKYSHITWNAIDIGKYGSVYAADKYGQISGCITTIENPHTGKFFAINGCDKARYIHFPHFKENCIELFAVTGTQIDDIFYQSYDIKFTPMAATSDTLTCYRKIEELYNKNQINDTRTIPTKLFFRAAGRYLFRKYIEDDSRFDIQFTRIGGEWFAEELNQYKINIDINGVAEISSRTYEVMGLGSALIRPAFQTTKFHDPLIPDYHYAALKLDIKNFDDPKMIADAYIDRFEEIKKDPDYTKFLSENGRKWYEQNCTLEKYLDIMTTIINPNKLLT